MCQNRVLTVLNRALTVLCVARIEPSLSYRSIERRAVPFCFVAFGVDWMQVSVAAETLHTYCTKTFGFGLVPRATNNFSQFGLVLSLPGLVLLLLCYTS